MNIYIAIANYSSEKTDVHAYSDEAHFFESPDTLSELVKKEIDILPELKDNDMVFFVIENTAWNTDLMADLWKGRTIKQWSNYPDRTTWKGKIRLWKDGGISINGVSSGLRWILEHAKRITLENV